MTIYIDQAFNDQKRRGVKLNKNRALIPILPRLCKLANYYPSKNTKLNPLTKKPSKGYIPRSMLGDQGKIAQLEWNKILEDKFKNGTFRSADYQYVIKTLLKRYDTVKREEKIFNVWKQDFLRVIKHFRVNFGNAYTFEELKKISQKEKIKSNFKSSKITLPV
jgi:hypothetical protein